MIGNQRIQTRGKCTDIIPAQVFSLGTTIDVGQMLGGTKNGLKTEGLFKFDTRAMGVALMSISLQVLRYVRLRRIRRYCLFSLIYRRFRRSRFFPKILIRGTQDTVWCRQI